MGQADGERKPAPPNMCHSFSFKNGILLVQCFFNLQGQALHNAGKMIKNSGVCREFLYLATMDEIPERLSMRLHSNQSKSELRALSRALCTTAQKTVASQGKSEF